MEGKKAGRQGRKEREKWKESKQKKRKLKRKEKDALGKKCYYELSHDLYPNNIEFYWEGSASIKPYLCLVKAKLLGFSSGISLWNNIVLLLIFKKIHDWALDLGLLGILMTFTIKSKKSVFVFVFTHTHTHKDWLKWWNNDENFSHGHRFLFSVYILPSFFSSSSNSRE